MFRKDKPFIAGWIYFLLMFPLAAILPESYGEENGVIENLQMLWLFGGLILCAAVHDHRFRDWGGRPYALWKAGIIYYFLLIMREISWGRTFFPTGDGGFISYSEMGLYGQLVHPTVAFLILALLVLLYRAKAWRALMMTKIPVTSAILFLLFTSFAWVGERTSFAFFHGEVAEELAEFGSYMMMFIMTRDAEMRLRSKNI